MKTFESLSDEQKQDFYNVYTFHCSLHTIVGLTTEGDKSMKVWEDLHNVQSSSNIKRSESSCQTFIRSVCNLFFKDGGGAPGKVQEHCKMNGITNIHPFSGSSFNVILYNAAGYFLRDQLRSFILEVWNSSNRLQSALKIDIENDDLFIGCRIYGLIEKFVTGPFWRLVW